MIRQYETCWKEFISFIKQQKPSAVSEKFMLEFFFWLFDVGKLQVNMISYWCALIKPTKLGFDIDLTTNSFVHIFKSFFLQRSPRAPREAQWCLHKVLKTDMFFHNPSFDDLCMRTAFLVGLALGARVSDLHSLLRGNRFVKFDKDMNPVTLCLFLDIFCI